MHMAAFQMSDKISNTLCMLLDKVTLPSSTISDHKKVSFYFMANEKKCEQYSRARIETILCNDQLRKETKRKTGELKTLLGFVAFDEYY